MLNPTLAARPLTSTCRARAYTPAPRLCGSRPAPRSGAAKLLARASSSHAEGLGVGSHTSDPFVEASKRLQSLLATVGDGDSELVDSIVSQTSPEYRLQMSGILGAALTTAAVGISVLSGSDPAGGASWSWHSLLAGCLGLVLASPLVLGRLWSWSPEGTKAFPQLADMHLTQVSAQAAWFSHCRPWHVAAMMILDLVPVTLLLLPAVQGALMAGAYLYATTFQGLGEGMDDAPAASAELLQLGCLALTAAVVSIGKSLEQEVSEQEYEVVQSAVVNSERYYNLAVRQAQGASDPAAAAKHAARAARAFRSVAAAWIAARNDASVAAMTQCFLDVMALGGIWYITGDLAAPMAATLAINAVDYTHIYQAVRQREERAAGAALPNKPGSNSDGSNANNNPASH